jgi:serine/threonine protein kinase
MSTFEQHLRESLSGTYEIERELSGAGMSRVFVATDRALGRRVVIKVLPPELTAGVNRERFRREIQVAAQLQHPHIVTLLSAGEDGELLYYTMPFIEGESLRTALEKGPLSVRDVVRILHDVVDALAYAHARGVIHRDIKPGNILKLGQHAMVTDFGVAKALNAAMPVSGITTAGMAIGTPAYMAPEQLAGDPAADHRIDIYAVGLLAYELLTGESPFTGPSPQATMAAQLTRDPEPLYQCCPDVPPPLSAIIMQCLAKEPANRPPTAEALMSALDSITTSSGDVKHPLPPTLPSVRKRKRRLTIGAVAGVAAVAAALVVFSSDRGPETAERTSPARADSAAAAASAPVAGPTAAAASAAAAATTAAPQGQPAAPVPVVLTRADSVAIAEAVRKQLAEEEAKKGRPVFSRVVTDSIVAFARKMAIDSIIRATLPAGTAIPVWSESAPHTPRPPARIRRVAVIPPRASRREELNVLGKMLADSLQRALSQKRGYSVVSADSVAAVVARTRTRVEVQRAVNADLFITQSYAGVGDTMTVMVTIRDANNSPLGMRMASGKVDVRDPAGSIPAIIKLVGAQLDNLSSQWTTVRMAAPVVPGRGSN